MTENRDAVFPFKAKWVQLGKGLFAAVVVITPEMAAHCLERFNSHNRKLSPTTSERYGRDMAQGKWGLTGDTITFSSHCVLTNGQHRLQAAVASNSAFETVVISGVDISNQPKQDKHKVRGMRGDYQLAGRVHADLLPAMVNEEWRYREGVSLSQKTASVGENLAISADIRDIDGALEVAARCNRLRVSKAVIGFMAYNIIKANPDEVALFEKFIEGLSLGAGLGADSPILTLRNLTERDTWRFAPTYERVAKIIMTWNAYADGSGLQKLTWKGCFPSIAFGRPYGWARRSRNDEV